MSLAGIYDQRFTSRYPAGSPALIAAQLAWQQGLQYLTDETVRLGIDFLTKNNAAFPPGMHEFRDVCVAERDRIAREKNAKNPRLEKTQMSVEERNAKGKKGIAHIYQECPWLKRKQN